VRVRLDGETHSDSRFPAFDAAELETGKVCCQLGKKKRSGG